MYLISDKSDAHEKFKIFKTEVEKQCGKMIKVVRSNRDGEYDGKHRSIGQFKGSFSKYLEDYGIVTQYTKPGSLEYNEVAERHNRTLKDMVRTMMSRYHLPISLCVKFLPCIF